MPDDIPVGLTYDDVLVVPKRSPVRSRKDIDTSSRLSRNITLNIPIVSANMDTVTESAMAIAMAREGGIGIIHRFMSVEQQAEEVLKVKRSESIVIEEPYTLSQRSTIREAKEAMRRHGVSGLLVVDDQKRLVGIVTTRDLHFATDPLTPVSTFMTTGKDLVTAPAGTDIRTAAEILRENRIEKLPLVDEKGRLAGLITAKDLKLRSEFPDASKDKKGRLLVGAAVGVRGDFLERTNELAGAEVDVIVVDVAHGHTEQALEAVRKIRKDYPNVELVGGNVATKDGTIDLAEAGVDAVKVGVGSGSICTTRIVTGSGVPQLTAVMECAKAAAKSGVLVIADGGVRYAGDITKAIGAGASTVMIGSLFAGTDESPGITITREGKRSKLYRGMASFYATLGRKLGEGSLEQLEPDLNDYVPEGVEAIVAHRGSVKEIVRQLVGGLRSGMSYAGATTIEELRGKAEFIRITESGLKESFPHDVATLS